MKLYPLFLAVTIAVLSLSTSAADVDWSQVESHTVKVFYPGVASWSFLLSEDHGRGASVVRSGKKSCPECHGRLGEKLDVRADQIIAGELQKAESGEPFEPAPIAGAPGIKEVTFQAAFDAEHVYLRFQWPGSGTSVADPSVAEDGRADKLMVQLTNTIGTFRGFGCFITCHEDQVGMPANEGADTTLYGYYTRERDGGTRPAAVLDGFMSKDQFIDLLEVNFVGDELRTRDMYILEKRHEDEVNDVVATGGYDAGMYTAVIQRALSTGDDGDIPLSADGSFSLGFAIHDDKHKGRKHYVSFPISIGLSTTADVDVVAAGP